MNETYAKFYWTFRDQRPAWPLIACAIPLGIIAIFGMAMNLAVIFVTFRSKQLKNTANYLLALTSLFEVLHQHGHFIFVFTALSGQNFLDYQLAVKLATVSMFGLGGIGISMLLTGLDRLICVLFPQFPKVVKSGPYLGLAILICSGFGCLLVYYIFRAANAVEEGFQITGCIVDILQGEASAFYANSMLLTNTLTIIVYIVVGVVIRQRSVSNSSTADQTNRRLFRSLAIIISVNIGGYFANTLYIVMVVPYLGSVVTIWFWQTIIGIFLNISAASNAPILYMTSKEYRKAFQHEMRALVGVLKQPTSTTVHPQATATVRQERTVQNRI